MDKETDEITNKGMRHRIWRRIAVKSTVFAVWAIGILAAALPPLHAQGGSDGQADDV